MWPPLSPPFKAVPVLAYSRSSMSMNSTSFTAPKDESLGLLATEAFVLRCVLCQNPSSIPRSLVVLLDHDQLEDLDEMNVFMFLFSK